MQLRIWPAEPTHAGPSGEVRFTLAGRTWKVKVDIARSQAPGDPGSRPAGQQDRSAFHGGRHPGLASDASSGWTEYRQAVPPIGRTPKQKTDILGGSMELPRLSANENKPMENFWNSISQDQQRAFEAKACWRAFASGVRLMREGEEADHVAVILSGLTEIRVGENGAERVVAVRGPGQLIGERAALEISVRSATVVAIQPVEALVMRTGDFAAFISTHPPDPGAGEGDQYHSLDAADRPGRRRAPAPAAFNPPG